MKKREGSQQKKNRKLLLLAANDTKNERDKHTISPRKTVMRNEKDLLRDRQVIEFDQIR